MADTNEVVEEITEEVDGELEEEYYEDAEAEAEAEGEGQAQAEMAVGSITEVQDQTFVEIRLPSDLVSETQEAWNAFLNSASSREAAGEAIYAALFDSAPSLQSLFKTPRAVMAMRFMNGLNSIINAMHTPSELKTTVETLGFQHLDLEVTVPRVVIFRDAIVDLFDMEMGARFSSKAKGGMISILNYVGGAYIYVRREYAGRLKIIASSWRVAANKKDDELEVEEGAEEGAEEAEGEADAGKNVEGAAANAEQEKGQNLLMSSDMRASGEGKNSNATKVPTNFNEMFLFNSAVMGFAGSTWMNELLEVFDDIVTNVANSYRLQECCDTLSLSLAKYTGTINLPEYKAVMLAALRSLVPKDWDGAHEVAWTWLWENVERMLKAQMGKPAVLEKALERLILSLTEDSLNYLRREVYQRFFALAPAGQDYFKQSNTRLHFIAQRVVMMTIELFRDPWQMVDEISALGLRHVGFGIPTELFAPFVTSAIEVCSQFCEDPSAMEAFRWSLGLISKMLVQTITEGSTIVMKAINVNSAKQVAKAVACAPRGARAQWVLMVQVGTQDISPLNWAIESGSLHASKAMLEDLLSIRADRERYYYGVEELFARHWNIVNMICENAPSLLPTFLEGLVWRSRVTNDGWRRVNYYVKRLLLDAEGKFAEGIGSLCEVGDPVIISHPVINLCSNKLWEGLVKNEFIKRKVWFIFSLVNFMLGQTILTEFDDKKEVRWAILVCRTITYLLTYCRLSFQHARNIFRAYRAGETVRQWGVPIPKYLKEPYPACSFMMTTCLFFMLIYEPYFRCNADADWPTEICSGEESTGFVYSVFAMCAMGLHWSLMADLAVFSTGLSAFVLVCVHVGSEIGRFMVALLFLLLTFASAISVLEHDYDDMTDVSMTVIALFSITVRLYEDDYRDFQNDPILLTAVFAFVTASAILLLNLLIAQLNCSYVYVYANMVGFARLKRASVIHEVLQTVDPVKWEKWVPSLGLDNPLEFNEGDVGMAGGIQVMEMQSANLVTKDRILRYGGTCEASVPWTEDSRDEEDEANQQFEKLERMMKSTLKRLQNPTGTKKRKGGHTVSGTGVSGEGSFASEDSLGSVGSGGSVASLGGEDR
eukprot:TRINITY_DN20287_c0_g1_i1.p1 TRINITY_DN20287_c0_g1~~TRINITY_DN20287_c0_g1_i1.p1  ORF type:complete len:1108 (-),score=261.28 TRINITY_DN20287_c0_g1_i1:312-3635(-)